MFETFKNAFKVKEIRSKILWTFLFLLCYRIGCHIPVPGVGTTLLSQSDLGNMGYLQIMSMMTGGALEQGTLFAMGIGPYINASIIMQLLTVAIPRLEALSKKGEEGRKAIAQYTRIATLVLAVIQSIGILVSYGASSNTGNFASLEALFSGGSADISGFATFASYAVVVFFFTAGTCTTMWIGERITDKGVSNGISLLIFAGILATAGKFTITQVTTIFFMGDLKREELFRFIGYILIVVVVFGVIIFVNLGERKIPVQYAKQVKGRKTYGGQSTVIPIKVNANGVMPLIFAFSILTFPELIFTLFKWEGIGSFWSKWLGANSRYPFYSIALCLFVLGFAFFYSTIQFNPDDISKSIQNNGGFIPGIRPGKPTAIHLRRINYRITFMGALFLAMLALIPSLVFNAMIDGSATGGAFGATGMLIVVSVALEFNTQLESQIMMKNYKGFLK